MASLCRGLKGAQALGELVASTTGAGMRSEKEEPLGQCINEAIGSLNAAVARDVEPDFVEICFSLG